MWGDPQWWQGCCRSHILDNGRMIGCPWHTWWQIVGWRMRVGTLASTLRWSSVFVVLNWWNLPSVCKMASRPRLLVVDSTRLEWSWWYKTCRNSLCRYRETTYWHKNCKTKKMAKMFVVIVATLALVSSSGCQEDNVNLLFTVPGRVINATGQVCPPNHIRVRERTKLARDVRYLLHTVTAPSCQVFQIQSTQVH